MDRVHLMIQGWSWEWEFGIDEESSLVTVPIVNAK